MDWPKTMKQELQAKKETTFTTETCNGRLVHFGAVLVFFFLAVLTGYSVYGKKFIKSNKMARDGHYVSHNIQSAREYECECRRCLVWVAQTRYEETIALLWQAFVFITTPSLIPFILQCVFIQL